VVVVAGGGSGAVVGGTVVGGAATGVGVVTPEAGVVADVFVVGVLVDEPVAAPMMTKTTITATTDARTFLVVLQSFIFIVNKPALYLAGYGGFVPSAA
jgi:hypothetical protein